MSGKAMAIVGARGMGKTSTVRELLTHVHPDARLVYDVNGEYKDLFTYPLMTFDQFNKKANQVQNAFIVFEEATIFLNNRGNNMDVTEMLVRARHTNNTILFVFHSFRSVPRYLFDLLDYVIILKTNDNPDIIEQKFESPEFTAAFMEIKNAPFLKNESGRQYSPKKIFSIYG